MNDKVRHLSSEFEKLRSPLLGYLYRLTANRDDAEDLAQETYLKTSEKIDSFRNESSLKTWIFSIATNLAKDLLRNRKRWPVSAMDLAREESMRDPEHMQRFMRVHTQSSQGAFEIREHINFCFTCIGKTLTIEQQIALILKEVLEYKVSEIAVIMTTSEGIVKHLLLDGRKTMADIFEERCALVNQRGPCHQCSELNGIFNPRLESHENLRKLTLARKNSPDDRNKEDLFDLRMRIVRSIDPYQSNGAELQFCHMKHVANVIGEDF